MTKCKIEPAGKRLLVAKPEERSATRSTIMLPEEEKLKAVAIVTAVGPQVGSYKKGDEIIFRHKEIEIEEAYGEKYYFIKEEHILGKIV